MRSLQYEKVFEDVNVGLNSIINYFSKFKEGGLSGSIFFNKLYPRGVISL
jgi:hypothetical protein